jgi:hypothetical protein
MPRRQNPQFALAPYALLVQQLQQYEDASCGVPLARMIREGATYD